MSTYKRIISTTSEMRATSEGDEMSLVGYAAKFNSPSKPMTDKSGIQFVEMIAPGAFTRTLASGADVCCLYNHDSNKVLGRTKSGTLRIAQDDTGLAFRCLLDPRQQLHRDLHAAVTRGDISECSFAFSPNGDDGDDWQDTRTPAGWQLVRTLKDVNLFDVSAVTTPAYNDTSLSARDAALSPEVRSIVTKLIEKRGTSKFVNHILQNTRTQSSAEQAEGAAMRRRLVALGNQIAAEKRRDDLRRRLYPTSEELRQEREAKRRQHEFAEIQRIGRELLGE